MRTYSPVGPPSHAGVRKRPGCLTQLLALAVIAGSVYGVKQAGWLRNTPVIGSILGPPVIPRSQVAEIPREPEDIVSDGDSVWILARDGSLGRVDASTGSLQMYARAVPDAHLLIAGAPGRLWVAFGTLGRRVVLEVDTANCHVLRTIDTRPLLPNGVAAMTKMGGTIWLCGGNGLAAIDEQTGTALRHFRLSLPETTNVLLVPAEGALWCAGEHGNDVVVFRIDGLEGVPREVGRIASGQLMVSSRGAVAYGCVWFPYSARGVSLQRAHLARIEVSSNVMITRTASVGWIGRGGTGGWVTIRLAAANGHLWQLSYWGADHLDRNGDRDATTWPYRRQYLNRGAVDASGRVWMDFHVTSKNDLLYRADPP